MPPRLRTLTATLLAAVITGSVVWIPFVRFGYQSESLQLAFETATVFVAGLASYLVFGRYRESRSMSHLLLFFALLLLASTNFLYATTSGVPRLQHLAWVPLVSGAMASVVVAIAGFAPTRRLARGPAGGHVVAAWLGVLAILFLTAHSLRGFLPAPLVDRIVDPRELAAISGHPALIALQIVSALAFATAAFGFTKRAIRDDDQFFGWIGAGLALSAFARINYVLFPSFYTDWVTTGDLLRFGFYALLTYGGLREITAYWHQVAEARSHQAVIEERRRIARELHDGLGQELAFIAGQSRYLQGRAKDLPMLRLLATAADRALYESRRAITAFSRDEDEPLHQMLAKEASDVAFREGTLIELDLQEGIEVSHEAREALVRITREAVSNAARHGIADHVRLHLSNDDGVTLRVIDDGLGFEPGAKPEPGRGFGLVSMQERAEALGGRVGVISSPGCGTSVEIVLP